MTPRRFIAESLPLAVDRVRAELGPRALVLNVRRVPGEGWPRWWRKPQIEVIACPPAPAAELAEVRSELAEIRRQISRLPAPAAAAAAAPPPGAGPISAWLERHRLAPAHRHSLLSQLPRGETSLAAARGLLLAGWRAAPPLASNRHALIGPPGAGKTTALCKWLAQAVLMEGRRARVWRLDGEAANTAESLSVFAEILSVPVQRLADGAGADPAELVFIDLPGVDWRDPAALAGLAERLRALGGVQAHLVLNAAYDDDLLLAQARAFGALSTEVILTHRDEQPAWGKIWNLIFGTNCSVRFLSAGQNIPGLFENADPERLLGTDFP